MVFGMFGYLMDINVGKYFPSANELIGATGAPLDDHFWGNILKIFSKKIFKKSFKIFLNSLYYLVKVCVKKFPKICNFSKFSKSMYKSFYCLKTMVTSFFTLFLKGLGLMK